MPLAPWKDDPMIPRPAQVEAAPEVLMVVMQIDLEMTQRIASRAGDSWFQLSDGSLQALVNGEVNPSIAVAAGEWTRFRVIYAGWLAEALNFNVGCEMVLLAKDLGWCYDDFFSHDGWWNSCWNPHEIPECIFFFKGFRCAIKINSDLWGNWSCTIKNFRRKWHFFWLGSV